MPININELASGEMLPTVTRCQSGRDPFYERWR